ncbi:MAG: hypothetical protein ACT4ON_06550 [Bacteroidota bacterium]
MEQKNATNDPLNSLRVIDEANEEFVSSELPPLQKFIRSKGIYIAMAATVLGLFVGIPLLFWFASVTVINLGIIMLLIFGCGALGLIQWKYAREYLDMEYRHFAMYAFTGFGMCLINLILLLNYTIPVSTYTQTYNIDKVGFNGSGFEVSLTDNDNLALEGNLGNYFNEHFNQAPVSKNISVTFDKGLFGFDIIRACEFN